MTKITFKTKSITIIAGTTLALLFTLTLSGQDIFAVPSPGDTMITDLKDGPLSVITESGYALGYYDSLHVEHPYYVSARPSFAESGDPNDPDLIAGASLINNWTGLRDNDGNLIEGATIEQLWIAVSIEEANEIAGNGGAITSSSGGFIFKLVKQISSQQAQDAFGAVTIDNSETGVAIARVNAAEGYCG